MFGIGRPPPFGHALAMSQQPFAPQTQPQQFMVAGAQPDMRPMYQGFHPPYGAHGQPSPAVVGQPGSSPQQIISSPPPHPGMMQATQAQPVYYSMQPQQNFQNPQGQLGPRIVHIQQPPQSAAPVYGTQPRQIRPHPAQIPQYGLPMAQNQPPYNTQAGAMRHAIYPPEQIQHMYTPIDNSNAPEKLLDKRRLDDLVHEVDPNEQLDEDVKDALLQLTDDFVEKVITDSCRLAKHRNSTVLEAKDVQLCLERNFNMWIPGVASDDLRPQKKTAVTEAHKQRMALIRKTLKKQ